MISLFVFSGMRQNTVDTIPLCKNFLVYLVGPPKMTFFLKSLEKNKRLRETTDKRRKGKKKTINLLNINSNISDG